MRSLKKSRLARPVPASPAPAPSDYVERVNLAVDHIAANLHRPLRLMELAEIAAFSPFHFHRVFQSIVGETPADFAKRLRLERALLMMAHAKRASMTRIAMDCGFSSPSDFSRSFRQRFGIAPSVFDIETWRRAHAEEFDRMAAGLLPAGVARSAIEAPPRGSNPDRFRVRLRDLPEMTVAYIRVANPYHGDGVIKAAHRLMAWADREGFGGNQWLGYQWENPELVPLELCRYHVAVVAERFTPRGEIGRFRFPQMTVAEVEFRGGIDLEIRALRWLYGEWLPRSGYEPDDPPCFEAWIGRPFAHGTEHFEIKVWLPVRRG